MCVPTPFYSSRSHQNGNSFFSKRYEKALEDAITDNCAKTLISITFICFAQDSMNELEQPFTNVTRVEFYGSNVGSTLGQLKKWFPELTYLKFINTHVDRKCIHEHFPRLKSFEVSNTGKQTFTNSDLKVFVQLNPQLEVLHIRHDDDGDYDNESESDENALIVVSESDENAIIVNWDLLTFIAKNLKLKKLKLDLEGFAIKREWQSTINFESLTALVVRYDVSSHCLENFKITSDKLNELSLIGSAYCSEVNYETLATFAIRAKPRRLNIKLHHSKFTIDNAQVLKMTSMLPELQELLIECSWDDDIPDAVINLLINSNALKKLIGVFFFDEYDGGIPCPEYLQMQKAFVEKIVRHDIVASTCNIEINRDKIYHWKN